MTDELLGESVGGWRLSSFSGAGKSALVFKATRGTDIAAVKIFDPELVERFGKPTQLRRIERELLLKGEDHPNLIRILDGGECAATGYLFVVMEHIDWPNLGDLLKVVPRGRIWPIIAQIAKAARFLEGRQLAHRDIKPENIVIDPDFQSAKLLDLGVLRPFGDPNLTDEQARTFVGTLRYSSPEFLLRQEQDTTEGWRAITFYQLGAVIHDMVMGEPLFAEFSDPFAVLVDAVKTKRPRIEAADVSADLVVLASNCLVKPPLVRLELVDWDSFDPPTTSPSVAAAARERVRQRCIQSRAVGAEAPQLSEQRARATKRLLTDIQSKLEAIIRLECIGNDLFPRCEFAAASGLAADRAYLRVTFEKSPEHGLYAELCVCFTANVLDLDAEVINLDGAAALSNAAISDEVCVAAAQTTLYAGVLDDSVIKSRISDLLYVALDAAQARLANDVATAAVAWLDLDMLAKGTNDV